MPLSPTRIKDEWQRTAGRFMPRKAWDGFSFFLSGPQQMIKMGIIPLAILFTICLAIELERRRMEKERERSQLEEQQDAAVEEVNRILVESVRK